MPTRLFNYFLSLTLLSSALQAQGQGLTLEAAIVSALENNLGLRIAAYAPADALYSVEIEKAQFDPALFGNTSLQERQSAAANSSLDSASVPSS